MLVVPNILLLLQLFFMLSSGDARFLTLSFQDKALSALGVTFESYSVLGFEVLVDLVLPVFHLVYGPVVQHLSTAKFGFTKWTRDSCGFLGLDWRLMVDLLH